METNGKSGERKETGGGVNSAKSLQDIRKAHIQRVLEMAEGDVKTAANLLEIPISELRRWMTRLGIE